MSAPLQDFKKGEVLPVHARLHALELRHGPFMQGEIFETYGPLRYELAQFDDRPTEHLFMVYLMRDATSGLPTARVSLVDRFYFLPIAGPRARFGGIGKAPFQLLIERGFRYFYQPATFLYTARDQQYWAEILTIVDRMRRPHLNQRLVGLQCSSLLDLLLAAAVDDIRTYIIHSRERIARGELGGYSFLFGLTMRSHPSIFFLPFNQSVWRLPEQLDFLGSERVGEGDRLYVTEDTVIADTTPEELDLIMQGGRIRKEAREREGFMD